MCALPLEHEIEYPTSDGQPMAETTLHRKVMSDVIEGLERRYADIADVWVGGNLFLYYEKGNRKKSLAPDALLVRGVGKWDRDSFFLWEEKTPELIFEITSRSTRDEDQSHKKNTYERLGVAELVLFDPFGEYLEPRLQGYRLERRRYRDIPLNGDGSLDLRTTGITVRPEGARLRLVDTATQEKLLWNDEIEAARLEAEERAAQEAVARRAAEEQAAEEAVARRAAEERAAAAEERARALAEELARLRDPAKP
jgi:Uma2 family endonuclease